MEYDSIYIYGIVDGRLDKKLDSKGMGNESEVYCVPFKDITAIVSNTPFEEYNPTEENMGIAEIIIAKQRNGPVCSVHLAFMKEYTKFANLAREK